MFNVPAVGSATLIELLWTAAGVVGLLVVIPGLLEALRNIDALGRSTNGFLTAQDREAAAILARGHIRQELLRCLMMTLVIIVGLITDFTRTGPPGRPTVVSTVGIFLTILLFAIAGITALQSVLDRHQRRIVRSIFLNLSGRS